MANIQEIAVASLEIPNKIDKKDARIFWNVNKDGRITELIVSEFTESHNPQKLYKYYYYDIGNCLGDWDSWTCLSIALRLLDYGFQDDKAYNAALHELMKIKEFNKEAVVAFNWKIKEAVRAFAAM
jgi:hypothetical protein